MQASSEGVRPSGREVAELARAHIECHYASAVGCGTTSIATLLGVSSSLLCHRYRATYGVTIGQHVRRLRIGKARRRAQLATPSADQGSRSRRGLLSAVIPHIPQHLPGRNRYATEPLPAPGARPDSGHTDQGKGAAPAPGSSSPSQV